MMVFLFFLLVELIGLADLSVEDGLEAVLASVLVA
jgi:hypothetical protein